MQDLKLQLELSSQSLTVDNSYQSKITCYHWHQGVYALLAPRPLQALFISKRRKYFLGTFLGPIIRIFIRERADQNSLRHVEIAQNYITKNIIKPSS